MNLSDSDIWQAVQNNDCECSYSGHQRWTHFDNKMFENALAVLDLSSPRVFEKIMATMPWKSLEAIKSHYEELVADVAMIESDEVYLPNYDDRVDGAADAKRKGAPWTEEEHRLFLLGLDKFGKGEWRNIATYYVQTKTISQVASHGQKYFRRLKSCTPLDKRRSSIHDIRVLNSSIVETSARQPSRHFVISRIPQPQRSHPNNPAQSKQADVGQQAQNYYPSCAEATTLIHNSFTTDILQHDHTNHQAQTELADVGQQAQHYYPSFAEATTLTPPSFITHISQHDHSNYQVQTEPANVGQQVQQYYPSYAEATTLSPQSFITRIPRHEQIEHLNDPSQSSQAADFGQQAQQYSSGAEATTSTSKSSDSSGNDSLMFMGDDLDYDLFASYDELFSPPHNWFPEASYMPFI